MANARVTVTGLEELKRRVKILGKKTETKIARKAVMAGCQPIKKQMQANAKAHQDTGATSKSIAANVKQVKGITDGRVGPRSDFYLDLGTGKISRGKKKVKMRLAALSKSERKRRVRRPQKYAHLLEKGTRRSRAFPFIDRAGVSQQAAALAAVQATLWREIEAQALVLSA